MDSKISQTIAVAFPIAEEDRARLRERVTVPLPELYENGETQPCSACGMLLNVGPRTCALITLDSTVRLLCVECAIMDKQVKEAAQAKSLVMTSLDNPDSRAETGW